MSVYYPSVVVNLKIRFDEALTVLTVPDPTSVDANTAQPPLGGVVGGFLGAGVGALAGTAFDSVTGAVQVTGKPTTEPLITQHGDDNSTFIFNRVPKSLSVELPGYRQAGQFRFTIAYKELPIDPRVVRSAAVEVHVGTVSADDFAAGMRGEFDGDRRLSLLRTRDSAGVPRRDTLVLVGLVDDWEVLHDENTSTVEIKGRDLRSALIDFKLNTKPGVLDSILEQLDTAQPIDKVVQQILSYHPAAQLFAIETNPFEWPDATLPAPLPNHVVPRLRLGARGKSKGGKAAMPGTNNDMSFWDLITQFCYLVGAIPFFEGYALRIRPSRDIFAQQRAGFDPGTTTPFAGGVPRRNGDNDEFSVRRIVYGRDTTKLNFSRSFNSNSRPKTIRCVASDPAGETKGNDAYLVGVWPPKESANKSKDKIKNAKTQHVAPSGKEAHEEILTIPVPGIKDIKRLTEIAHSLFNEIGRNEMGGSCSTKRKLASFGGNNADPDLLRLRPGDGVEFLVDVSRQKPMSGVVSTATNFARSSFTEAVEHLRSKGISADFARVIVATSRGLVLELQRFFRVANVKYDWDGTIDVNFDFQNYFVVRYDVDDNAQKLPGEVKRMTVQQKKGPGT